MTNSFAALALAVLASASPAAPRAATRGAATPAASARTDNPAADKPAASYAFTFDTLLAEAKRRAAAPYAPQRSSLPAGLDKLSPEQYRSIHFNPDAGIWRAEQLPFRLELLRANLQSGAVTVSTVEDGLAQDLVATPAMFEMASTLPPLGKVSLPLSGFRLRTQINSKKVWDEFLVFQGASYFRAVAQNLLYGLSARGLAINTAEPSGEEFPAFTHFWIERPGPRARSIVIYALLESASTTGAYRFTVQPGVETIMDVQLTLFPRTDMRVVGIAPLTSMFLFDETNRGRLDDYRPEVHDSDGLQITSKTGEHIFRQLANPSNLQVSTFTTQAPQGFGLVQRSREQSDFQDFENLYERRPSAWVEPNGDWGAGAVELRGDSVRTRKQRQHRRLLAPGASLESGTSGAIRVSPHLAGGAGPAQGLGQSRGNPLGRQPRRQAARVHPGYRRRRREDRRSAARSGRFHRQGCQRRADVEQRPARIARQL